MEEVKKVENVEYTASSIKVLKGLEGVRKRPAMYIGSTDANGLHHLVYELIDNSVDEAVGGYCSEIEVTIYEDGSCEVEDNGRGIPVDIHPEENRPAVEVVMTTLHSGGKFDHSVYKVSGGLHGVGGSVVNALSEKLELWVKRDGKIWYQKYKRGKAVCELQQKGDTDKTGTTIRFWPDPKIFEVTEFSYDRIVKRAEEIAYLVAGLKVTVRDKRKKDENGRDVKETFKFEGGIKNYVLKLTQDAKRLYRDPIYIKGEKDLVQVEVAIQHTSGYKEVLYSYANNISTPDGGTHVAGLRSSLTKAVNQFSERVLKKKISFDGDDVREGLCCVISIKTPNPQFEGQTKSKLGNSEIKGIVEDIVYDGLVKTFESNPSVTEAVVKKTFEAYQAREAAKKAKELVRKKVADDVLPGKLADCQTDTPEDREIFIVEGESAGGSAKQARDRVFQAILPIRGKILNVEKASKDKMFSSEEIRMIISALGCGIGKDIDVSALRYHKIIIMSDADVDGSHIRTLLLTFFWRQAKPLVEGGFVYIAQPPLFKIRKGDKDEYLQDEDDLKEYIIKSGIGELKSKIKKPDSLEKIVEPMVKYATAKTESSKEVAEKDLQKILKFPIEIEMSSEKRKISSVSDLETLLEELVKKKISVQRFKGLGEMNPQQLWETTLNPKTRTLKKVTVKDAEYIDEIFSILMGEKVEPRRKFIEEHALEVKNLDI